MYKHRYKHRTYIGYIIQLYVCMISKYVTGTCQHLPSEQLKSVAQSELSLSPSIWPSTQHKVNSLGFLYCHMMMNKTFYFN